MKKKYWKSKFDKEYNWMFDTKKQKDEYDVFLCSFAMSYDKLHGCSKNGKKRIGRMLNDLEKRDLI